jgi:superfamily II DNA or RNA helicase
VLEQSLGAHSILAIRPGRLDIKPYQLVPIVRALEMSRVRLLLADGVGLGKTIQAGLVVTELMARRLVQRVLIVTPAGPLLDQWRREMRDRFGLRMTAIDRDAIEQVRRQSELGANPFASMNMGLVSLDFLKQERVLAELERTTYDLVIIDEAHHCAAASRAGLEVDHQRRRLAEVLADRCDALLLLTATPHDGYDESFASLLKLLDPSLLEANGEIRGGLFRRNVIRRLKSHLRDPATGRELWPDRQVVPHRISVTQQTHPTYVTFVRTVMQFVVPALKRALRNREYGDALSLFTLLKRSVSTATACRSTLVAVQDRFGRVIAEESEGQKARRERVRSIREARRRLAGYGCLAPSEEQSLAELETEQIAQELASIERQSRESRRRQARATDISTWLDRLVRAAEAAMPHDPKLAAVVEEVLKIRRGEPSANILVFTEYADSLDAVVGALEDAGLTVLTLRGTDGEQDRLNVTERFSNEDGLVMVCTDTASEGLNLHQKCHHLVHLELPFNPNRIEQRNGRIDRYGQTHPPMVRYFYLGESFEEKVLFRLVEKYENQRKLLTYVPNTLGDLSRIPRSEASILRAVVEDKEGLFAVSGTEAGTATDEDAGEPTERDEDCEAGFDHLLEEIERSYTRFVDASRTNEWLGAAGLNADAATVKSAADAQFTGERAGGVDLLRFVSDAIRLGGGRVRPVSGCPAAELSLPPSWNFGLTDMTGLVEGTRTVLVTVDPSVLTDLQKRPVGFLGRSHPLVRHAIDRVRAAAWGDSSKGTDLRATLIRSKVSVPTLVVTVLARLSSRAGIELERVLSVRLDSTGQLSFSDSPHDWLSVVTADSAIAAPNAWSKHFANWATALLPDARLEALRGFLPIAESCEKELLSRTAQERQSLDRWLSDRARERLGGVDDQQRPLFGAQADSADVDLTTPEQRLRNLLSRDDVPAKLRGGIEADLAIYADRVQRLEARATLGDPEILPLGLLMVLPEEVADVA